MSLAPDPRSPERPGTVYERELGVTNPERRGPLRFEEGVATDTSVPRDFQLGMEQGWRTAPGRPNQNLNVFEKSAAETMQERAHLGSAAWVDSPDLLGEFAQGSFADYAENVYEQVNRNGGRYQRITPSVVND